MSSRAVRSWCFVTASSSSSFLFFSVNSFSMILSPAFFSFPSATLGSDIALKSWPTGRDRILERKWYKIRNFEEKWVEEGKKRWKMGCYIFFSVILFEGYWVQREKEEEKGEMEEQLLPHWRTSPAHSSSSDNEWLNRYIEKEKVRVCVWERERREVNVRVWEREGELGEGEWNRHIFLIIPKRLWDEERRQNIRKVRVKEER